MISLHTFAHPFAVFTNTSPFSESFIGDENAQGVILRQAGLTTTYFFMTVLLLGLVCRRWNGEGISAVDRPFRRPGEVLKRLHRLIGMSYWFVFVPLIPVTLAVADHAIAIGCNTPPHSDTIVANSIDHEGLQVWNSALTILDSTLSVILFPLIHTQWRASMLATG